MADIAGAEGDLAEGDSAVSVAAVAAASVVVVLPEVGSKTNQQDSGEIDMHSFERTGKAGRIILVIVVILVVVGLSFFLAIKSGYDRAIRFDEAVSSNWAQIDNQLERRHDLIGNLMETVKGYAKHEKELFEHVADARKAYFQAKGPAAMAKANGMMGSVLSRLLVLQERYPDLKANQSFLKFQDELAGTENRIAVARRDYNNAVRAVNTYSRSFFGRFFCAMAGVEKAEYFEAPEEKKAVPKVAF